MLIGDQCNTLSIQTFIVACVTLKKKSKYCQETTLPSIDQDL